MTNQTPSSRPLGLLVAVLVLLVEAGVTVFLTAPTDLDLVSRALPAHGFTVLSAKLGYRPKNPVDPASLSAEQVVERLEAAQIANAQLNDMHDLWQHAQLRARDRWTEVASPVGPLPALLPPAVPNTWTARMDAIPALGQHTAAILAELGYDAAAIADLETAKAI